MNSSLSRRKLVGLGTASALAATFGVRAQDAFPNRPIALVNRFQAGGSSDVFFRGAADLATRYLPNNQTFVLESRPGAGGVLATQYVARSKPDGYTLLQFTSGIFNQPYMVETPYHPLRDFTYIIGMVEVPVWFITRADAPWKTIPEFMAAAKEKPGQLTYSSPGVGSEPHIWVEELARIFDVKLNHVPYKGAEYWQAVGGGHIDLALDAMAAKGLVDAGRVRVLAVASPQRLKQWPQIQTLEQQGVRIDLATRFGLVGPKDLPVSVVTVLHDAFQKAMNDPGYEQLLDRLTMVKWYSGTSDFQAYAQRAFTFAGTTLNRLQLATRKPD